MNKQDNATILFNSGFNCCQTVLVSFCEELGLERETALRMASGFGAGHRRGETCGAVTGALMVLGLKYGYADPGDEERKQGAYARTLEFMERFEKIYSTIKCRDILGYDVSKEEEYLIIKEKDLFHTICIKAVRDAIGILNDMLLD